MTNDSTIAGQLAMQDGPSLLPDAALGEVSGGGLKAVVHKIATVVAAAANAVANATK